MPLYRRGQPEPADPEDRRCQLCIWARTSNRPRRYELWVIHPQCRLHAQPGQAHWQLR